MPAKHLRLKLSPSLSVFSQFLREWKAMKSLVIRSHSLTFGVFVVFEGVKNKESACALFPLPHFRCFRGF